MTAARKARRSPQASAAQQRRASLVGTDLLRAASVSESLAQCEWAKNHSPAQAQHECKHPQIGVYRMRLKLTTSLLHVAEGNPLDNTAAFLAKVRNASQGIFQFPLQA